MWGLLPPFPSLLHHELLAAFFQNNGLGWTGVLSNHLHVLLVQASPQASV